MGGRGLLSKTGGAEPWKIWDKNAEKYGLTLVKADHYDDPWVNKRDGSTIEDEVRKRVYLNAALQTINTLNNEILGVNTSKDAMPRFQVIYGGVDHRGREGIAGSAVPDFSDSSKYGATIYLHNLGLMHSSDTAAHEYIHALTFQWTKDSFATVAERQAAHDKMLIQEGICRNALVRIGALKKGQDMVKSVWKDNALTIHRYPGDDYGAKSYHETLTTSVQMVMRYGDKASPYAKAVVAELRREARRRHAGIIKSAREYSKKYKQQ